MVITGPSKIALFDGRIHNFPYVTAMPHLNWSTFKGGIIQFALKSKKEKLLATGSFGGFRSTAFISALIQIYHAIGFNDEVLSNNQIYSSDEGLILNLVDIRSKIQRAIESLLDAYFDCKRKEWDPSTLEVFQTKLKIMEVHVLLVWELKQALLQPASSTNSNNKMRNLHKHIHLPIYIKNYGSLIHMDTSTFESFHKVATTAIWQKTSKRHNALFLEMTNGIMLHDYNRLLNVANQIVKHGLDYIPNCTGVLNLLEGVRFQRISNTTAFPFLMQFDNSEFQIDNTTDHDYWKTVSVQFCLNTPKKFRDFLFGNRIGDAITHAYPSISWNERFAIDYGTKIVQGISFVSDEESQMGKGTIYATARYNKNDQSDDFATKPRYDYVFIQYEGEDDTCPSLARVILMIEIEDLRKGNAEAVGDAMIILFVQLMQRCDDYGREITKKNHNGMLGDLYKWLPVNSRRTSSSLEYYRYDIVAVQSIIRPAFVIPIFREGYNPVHPNPLDRFIVLDRRYFDRSGWGIVNKSSVAVDSPAEQNDYLSRNQTEANMLKSRLLASSSTSSGNYEMKRNCKITVHDKNDDGEVEEAYLYSSSDDDLDVDEE